MAKNKRNEADPLTEEQRAYVESGGATTSPVPDEDRPAIKLKRERRQTPPELRGYYVIFGAPLSGAPLERIGRWATKARAVRWIGESGELLRGRYEAVEVVYCKRKDYLQLR